jgi:hypothetical protein
LNFNTASNGGRPPLKQSATSKLPSNTVPEQLEIDDLQELFQRIALRRQFTKAILHAPNPGCFRNASTIPVLRQSSPNQTQIARFPVVSSHSSRRICFRQT